MKQVKIYVTALLIFCSATVIAQRKTHKPPLPPPPPMKIEKAATPEKVTPAESKDSVKTGEPVTPSPPGILSKGHPRTRNGENVWVADLGKQIKPGKLAVPPPPPPPPPVPSPSKVKKL